MVYQMRPSTVYCIAAVLVLALFAQSLQVFGQTVPIATHVVINEVETDPPGDDSHSITQWVELYNPTSQTVNVGGWTIGATTGLRNVFTIAQGTTIPSQGFLVYTYGPSWFPHVGATVQLKDSNGVIVDSTPPLTDQQNDFTTWQRIYDGLNTNSTSDWIFKMATLGYSNGKMPTTTATTTLSLLITSDKQSYTFADTATISGQVSQLLAMPGSAQTPQTVSIALAGPNGFSRTFTLYPDNNLKFSTTAKLDQVLGYTEGNYQLTAVYGSAKATASFQLGSEAFVPPPQAQPITISMGTDKSSYNINEPIVLSGTVSKVIPLTPLTYKVYDTTSLVYQGTIFPDSQGHFTTSNPYQQSVATSGLLINSVNPVYGQYTIIATYGGASNSTTFILFPLSQLSNVITLSTDKSVYVPGDMVTFSGKTSLQGLQNTGLSPSLVIVQTSTTGSAGTQTSGNRGIVPNTANVKTFVNMASDNTFSYQFQISSGTQGLGNYRAMVIVPQGTAEADFIVAENPSAPQGPTTQPVSNAPLSITTDKASYAVGDTMVISGKVANPVLLTYSNAGVNVKIDILNSTGQPIYSQGSFINNIFVPTSTTLSYSAYPDNNGYFQVSQTVTVGVFHPGNYTLRATYSNLKAATSFNVYNPLSVTSAPLTVSTDKQVYAPGDTVQLTGQTSGIAGQTSYSLTVLKPDGNQISTPIPVTNGQFSWSWTVPSTSQIGSTGVSSVGSVTPTSNQLANVYGIYRVTIHSEYYGNTDLYFQVAQNPQPNQAISPISIQTDKTNYISTDVAKISGEVIPVQNAASAEQNTMAQLTIFSDTGQAAYRQDAVVNLGGQFHVLIPFHPGVWKTGNYRLYVQYLTLQAQTNFKVTDPYNTTSTKLQVFMTTDTDKYLPGQTVLVTGRTSYIVSLEPVDLAFGLANDTIISEGQVASKKGNILPVTTIPFDQTGSFFYDYKIPSNAPLGNYTIVANLPFGAFNAYYQVVNKLPIQNVTTITNQTQPNTNVTQVPPPSNQTMTPSKIGPNQQRTTNNVLVIRNGMISYPIIPIQLVHISAQNKTYFPREIDGLLRVNPGDENNVFLKVSAPDGTCIIGQEGTCQIFKSTSQSGSLYQITKWNGTDYMIGYSGAGLRLQQFTIIPQNASDVFSDGQWKVEIIKKNEVTRFYYQVSYLGK